MSALLLRARLFLLLARPPLLLLLAMSGALGAASAGAALELGPTVRAFLVVVPCLVYAVSLNDLADVRVDRINLAGDPTRPLVGDPSRARDVRIVAAVAAVASLLLAAAVGREAALVTGLGLLVATAYSAPPLALSTRGSSDRSSCRCACSPSPSRWVCSRRAGGGAPSRRLCSGLSTRDSSDDCW